MFKLKKITMKPTTIRLLLLRSKRLKKNIGVSMFGLRKYELTEKMKLLCI